MVILQQTRNSELAVLPLEEISLAPDPDADASAPEAPADSDDTNGTEAAAASDAPAQAPHTEAPAAAQPAAPAVPTLPQTGTTGFIYATSDIQDAGLGEVKSFAKTTDAVEALKNGQVDCVILDNQPAQALVAANADAGLSILDTEYAVEDYAAAVSKDNAALTDAINGALKDLIADGTVQSIIDKYIPAEAAN